MCKAKEASVQDLDIFIPFIRLILEYTGLHKDTL